MSVMPLDISGNPISPRDLAAHYRAVHAKLWTPTAVPRARIAPTVVWEPPKAIRRWKRVPVTSESFPILEFYPPRPMLMDDIVAEVAFDHGMSVFEMKQETRKARFVAARQEAMYRLKVERHLSNPKIAMVLKLKNHTTVLHGIHKFCENTGAPLPEGMKLALKYTKRRPNLCKQLSTVNSVPPQENIL